VLNTYRIRNLLKKAFTPITIMFIPHSNAKPLSFKISSIGIVLSILLWLVGTAYVFSVAVDTAEYQTMKMKLNYYSEQFLELRSTISALKKAESEFKRLFSLGSKDRVIEHVDTLERGSIDIEAIRQEILKTVETVGEIKDYLHHQKNLYLATPRHFPVNGTITSPYGRRKHPRSGEEEFHSGIDISAPPGTSVRATADGIVIFSGWGGSNGRLVVLEHGFGFRTFYAHNKENTVAVGQKIKRGDIVAYVGSTGNATGPHIHYEIWKDGRHVNPTKYIEGR